MIEKIKKYSLLTLKWGAIGFVSLFVTLTLSLFALTSLRPLKSYQPQIEKELKRSLQAKTLKLESLNWNLKIFSLSLEAQLKNLSATESPQFDSLNVPNLRIRIFPLAFFASSRIKVNADINQATIKFPENAKETKPDVDINAQEKEALSKDSTLPSWTKRLELKLNLNQTTFNASHSFQPGEVNNVSDIQFLLKGFPGTFEFQTKHQVSAKIDALNLNAQGPWTLKGHGKIQSNNSGLEHIELEDCEADLSHLELNAMKIFEKPTDYPLSIKFGSALHFKGGELEEISLEESLLRVSQLNLKLSAYKKLSTPKMTVKWDLKPTQVDNFRLPLYGLGKTPTKGLVDSSGTYTVLESGESQANWRMFMNNLKINVVDLPDVDPKNSHGDIVLSFVNEGSLNEGLITAPRTEFHFDGSKSRIEIPKFGLVKEEGAKFQSLIKLELLKDRLQITNFFIDLFNASLSANGSLNRVSSFWKVQESPELNLSLKTNRIDLSTWSPYIDFVRKSPALEGFAELNVDLKGTLDQNSKHLWEKLAWQVKKFQFSNVSGSFNPLAFERMGLDQKGLRMNGPFLFNLMMSGRGKGTVMDQAQLLSDIDLSAISFEYDKSFRKAAQIPLRLEIAAEATPTQLKIKRGSLTFHELLLKFAGLVSEGSRQNRISLVMQKPINLSNWKELYPKSANLPLSGLLQWKGSIGFSTPQSKNQKNEVALDWKNFSLTGQLEASKINGPVGDFKNPVRDASFRMLLEPTRLNLPFLNFSMGDAKINLSGSASFLGASPKKQSTQLSEWMKLKAWDVNAQLSINKLDPMNFETLTEAKMKAKKAKKLTKIAPASMGQQIEDLLNNEYLKLSNLNLGLRAGEGSFSNIAFKNLNARIQWDNSSFKMAPFSMEALKGKISGTTTLDASRYYQAKENPEIRATLKVQNLNVRELARATKSEMSESIDGNLNGDVVLASQGFESYEMIQNSKGRVVGSLSNAYFNSFQLLDGALSKLINQAAAKNFLSTAIKKEQCLRERFEAQIDAQISGGNVDLQNGKVRFNTGSTMELSGQIQSNLAVDLKGRFHAGERCISGDVRRCLADDTGLAMLPFTIQGTGTEASAQMSYKELSQKVAGCVGEMLKKRAEAIVQPQIQREVKKLEDAATQKIKDIFRGKTSN